MKAKQSLKTLYRSPVRMILTFILVVAVTFTLFSQVLEHAVTVREIDKAAQSYDGVGAVEVEKAKTKTIYPVQLAFDPRVGANENIFWLVNQIGTEYAPVKQDNIDIISKLPYVTSMDTRYMTAGVMTEYSRIHEGLKYYNYVGQTLVEGTLTAVRYDEHLELESYGIITRDYYLTFNDIKVVGGKLTSESGDKKIVVSTGIADPVDARKGGIGTQDRIKGVNTPQYKYTFEEIDSMVVGNQYVFLIRSDCLLEENYIHSDYYHELWFEDTLWDVTGVPNYLETEEFSEIKEMIDLVNLNHHTFDVVYTDDMGSIMRFSSGNMTMVDGRMITPEDSLTNPNVCVISRDFAKENDLNVGNKVTMQLGDKLFEQYKGLGAIPVVPSRVSDSYTEVELEIVGVYSDLDTPTEQSKEPNWGYSINTFFVPKALLNVSEEELANHTFAPGEVSFVVEDAWNIPAFLDECAPIIEEMGLTLIFEDENWLDMVDGFTASKELAVIKIGVLSTAVLVATWFVAMLYILGRKKDYAVMRVLGTTVRKSNASMLIPFMALVLASVIVGAVAAYINTSRTIESSNALQVLSEFAIDTSIPFGVVVLCVVIEVALAFVIALMMLINLGKKPPLVLIQDNAARRKKAKKNTVIVEPENIQLTDLKITPSDKLQKHRKYERRFVWKYIFRHIKRTVAKALLTILLCTLLLNVIGQLDIMKRSYLDLVNNTEVSSNFIGGLPLGNISKLEESGYVTDIYYWEETEPELYGEPVFLTITNDIQRSVIEECEIVFADGYDISVMDELGNYLIVGNGWIEDRGYKLGAEVWLGPPQAFVYEQSVIISRYRRVHPDEEISDGEIIFLNQEEFFKSYDEGGGDKFTIVGSISTESDEYRNKLFTPGTEDNSFYYGKTAALDVVEAEVIDNNLVDEYREFGQELAGGSVTEGVMFVMDTSKLENLRNTLRIVEMLYPIAIVVTLVIGAFLCGLIIVQTSKDIAIMRVLGTSKAKTRTILVIEQMLLCVVGIIIAGIILYIRGALTQMWWVFCVYAFVILIASIVASVAASRKNVLELLQTKE